MLILRDVYETPGAVDILYQLLEERPPAANIKNRGIPSLDVHRRFVASQPYDGWYLVADQDEVVGAVYLTPADEIGVFVFKEYQGMGHARRAIGALVKAHPRERYLANIAPGNGPSLNLFKKFGFIHIQETYEIHQ